MSHRFILLISFAVYFGDAPRSPPAAAAETLVQFQRRLSAGSEKAYKTSPFAVLSKDYLARFSRDPKAHAGTGEVIVDSNWKIVLPKDLSPLGRRLAGDLADFLDRAMRERVGEMQLDRAAAEAGTANGITLLDSGCVNICGITASTWWGRAGARLRS